MIKTLAIETSCDDTSVGIISLTPSPSPAERGTFVVEKLLAYSQIQNHQQYGGVVPEIASRLHSEKIIEILEHIGRDEIKKVDFISVTMHPGLPGALVVGKAVANLLGDFFAKPVVQVNHVYGHLFSLLLERSVDDIQFPLAVLTASGGHNDLYVVNQLTTNSEQLTVDEKLPLTVNCKLLTSGKEDKQLIGKHVLGNYSITKIGQTLDDAAGECFDKVARMLGGPYPGGQWISEKAGSYSPDPSKIEGRIGLPFKRIFLSKDGFDFSFSGMKSQVSGLLKEFEKKGQIPPPPLCQGGQRKISEELVCEIAHEFQEAVVEVLIKKLIRAGIKYDAKTLGIAGGVSCNERLREYLNQQLLVKQEKFPHDMVAIRPVKKVYSTDNAAMIGLVGILQK